MNVVYEMTDDRGNLVHRITVNGVSPEEAEHLPKELRYSNGLVIPRKETSWAAQFGR
jgi:hypothetical protein